MMRRTTPTATSGMSQRGALKRGGAVVTAARYRAGLVVKLWTLRRCGLPHGHDVGDGQVEAAHDAVGEVLLQPPRRPRRQRGQDDLVELLASQHVADRP